MSERREPYLLQTPCKDDIMETKPPDTIMVSRKELEQEHTHLLGRLQQLRRLLGYQPLPTGKQLRREQST
jgi:hypothetical protein